jgi:hypothetical protein
MNKERKKSAKHSLITGVCYALGMAVFEYTDGTGFSIGYFLFNSIFFGTVMYLGLRLDNE